MYKDLEKKLFSFGGNSIFGDQIQYDPDAELILKKGNIFSGEKGFVEMEPNACHWNVSELFERGIVDHIVIGYALSNEDIWFQHTWAIGGKFIVDTSEVNFSNIKLYFGVILDNPHSFVQLCRDNPKGNGKVRRMPHLNAVEN